MTTLRKLLQDAQIDSRDSLRRYVEKYQAASPVLLKVVRSIDLELDDESRTYRERLEFNNTIFDVPNLLVANSRYVSFINCIFTGNVTINQKITEIESIYFDYCIFSGSLHIGCTEKVGSVELNSVNAGEVMLCGVGSPSMRISNCRIGNLLIAECDVTEFNTFCNEFSYVDIGSNKFGHVSFSHAQLNIKKQPAIPDEQLVKNIFESFSEFFFTPALNLNKMSATEKKSLRSSTFKFFADYSDIGLNKEAIGHLKYLQILACQPNRLLYWTQVAIGGFVKPLHIVKLALITLMAFAFFFWYLPCCQFLVHNTDGVSVARSLTFAEAFYYSGITFTTIGYGDISPVGWARLLSIIEGLFGIVLTSSFLISLVRKYAE